MATNFFSKYIDAPVESAISGGLGAVTNRLNSLGLKTPNLGIQNFLTSNASTNRIGADAAGGLGAFLPFGTNPTQAQQAQTASNPALSIPSLANATPGNSQAQNLGQTSNYLQGPSASLYTPPSALTSGSSSTASTALPSRLVSYNGQSYDLSDPASRSQYFNDVVGGTTTQANQQYDLSKANLTRSQAEELGNIQQQLGTLASNRSDFDRSVNEQGVNLNNSYDHSAAQRQNSAYQGDAFQGASIDGQNYEDNQRLQALGDLQSQQTSQDNLFNQSDQQLTQAQSDAQSQYQQDSQSLDNQRNAAIQSAKDTTANGLGTYDAYQSPSFTPQDFSSKYNIGGYVAPTVSAPDVSQYQPAFGSTDPGTSAAAAGISGLSSPSASSLTPQTNYFGYAPTSAQQNYLQNYFKTGNVNA